MKFLDRMLTAFLARQKPDSTKAKPAFIQNTRNAVRSVHIVSAATLLLATLAVRSATCVARSGAAAGACCASTTSGDIVTTNRASTDSRRHSPFRLLNDDMSSSLFHFSKFI